MRRFVAVVLLVAGSLVAPPVLGQGGNKEAAVKLFNAGREDMKRNDYAAAYEKLSESQRLDPSPGTLLNLALCEENLGRLAAAWAHIQEVLAQLPADDARAKVAKEHQTQIDARLPRLTIHLAPDAPATTRIALDGNELPATSLRTPLPLDPGRHVVLVGAPGAQPKTVDVELAEGERKEITASPAGVTTARPRAEEPKNNTLAYVMLGVGGAGVVTGGVLWAVLNKKHDIVENNCDDQKRCNAEGMDAADSGKKLTPIYTGAWIVGAAGLGVGAYLLLTGGESSAPSTQVGAAPLPGGGAVRLEGRF